jgi:Domain of Unknown Function (DUF1080)
MWRISAVLLSLMSFATTEGTAPVHLAQGTIIGRWDITIAAPSGAQPSWLEVRPSGNGILVGQFVGVNGSARPISRVELTGGVIRFSIPPQWEAGKSDLHVEARLQGDALSGSMTFPDGKTSSFTAKRAPQLIRSSAPVWGAPITLFNGKDLTGWHARGANSQWRVANGILQNVKASTNLITDRSFTDYQLHLEFRYPKGSNSGAYQRGRYEVQIEDSVSTEPQNDMIGGVYGFIAPSEIAAKKAGDWQTYDITLVGRMITIVLNGKTVVCNREIPGPTGGALDSDEGVAGPLMLQGDEGPVEYRNITVRPAK